MSRRTGYAILIALLAVVLVFLAPTPVGHWFIYSFLIINLPMIALIFFLGLISLLALGKGTGWFSAAAIVSVAIVVFCMVWFPALTRSKIAGHTQADPLTELPASTEVRYTPMKVALTLAKNKYQDPRHHISDIDPILMESGDIGWIGFGEPTGLFNSLFGNTEGIVTVSPDQKVTVTDQSFACGEGMGITDDIHYRLWTRRYFSDLTEFYPFIIDGEYVVIAPYITWRFNFPVMVPDWGGTFVVHPDCRIELLSPSQALQDERLVGARLVPEEYALWVARSWAYRGGIANVWFTHRDQTEIPSIDGESNQMPYLMPTTDGQKWFVAFEPFGPAYSIYKMLFVDARTAQVQIYSMPTGTSVVSPNKAAGFIQAQNNQVQWYRRTGDSSSGSILAVEPRPLVRDGVLYWMMSQTNLDYAGVTLTYLVRGTDQVVLEASSLSQLKNFLVGADLRTSLGQAETPPAQGVILNLDRNFEDYTDEQLLDLIQRAAQELRSR